MDKERIIKEIEKIKHCTMFTADMQAGYFYAIDKILEFFKKEDDEEKIKNMIDDIKNVICLTEFMQWGYEQAIERIAVIINGGSADDYKHKKERKTRCNSCAYLYEDKHGNWICDKYQKDVIIISENECDM